jgi:hypothetical protein
MGSSPQTLPSGPSERWRSGVQVFIKATPEAIWEAITTPEFTERYFYVAVTWPPPAAG